jgi:hypothetical protein
MNVREAILAAASHIERNPGEFRFHSISIPTGRGCGTPGCAIGWIGFFAGAKDFFAVSGHVNHPGTVERGLLGVSQHAFYKAMNELRSGWTYRAQDCADALRLYADAYHPATERPIQYPDWNAIASAPLASQAAAPAGEVRS